MFNQKIIPACVPLWNLDIEFSLFFRFYEADIGRQFLKHFLVVSLNLLNLAYFFKWSQWLSGYSMQVMHVMNRCEFESHSSTLFFFSFFPFFFLFCSNSKSDLLTLFWTSNYLCAQHYYEKIWQCDGEGFNPHF